MTLVLLSILSIVILSMCSFRASEKCRKNSREMFCKKTEKISFPQIFQPILTRFNISASTLRPVSALFPFYRLTAVRGASQKRVQR